MKIVILDGYACNAGDLSWDGFEVLGELVVYDRTAHKDDIIQERIGNADAVILNKTPISADTINKCSNLKYIGILATGYNIVDIEAARAKNVAVTNIPTYGTYAVGQFAIALLLEICHHVGHHDKAVHEGKWEANPDWSFWDYPLIELYGKTMGIIGYGRIGQVTGNIAQALGMNVIAVSPDKTPGIESSTFQYVELDELLEESDVISLHCPLLESTRGIINKDAIAKMKDGVIIINDSRGPLIVEEDLAAALNSGKVYAAGLDVVSLEPIRNDNPLLMAKNCIITPHMAWAPVEARKRLIDIAVENLKGFIDGKSQNLVN